MPAGDFDLLQRFAKDGDQQAFARLVNQNINLVFSAALRRVGDRQLAEDITQAVFVILARKAKQMRPSKPLSGWLLTCVRYASTNAIKMHRRRQRHESSAGRASLARGGGACSADPSEALIWQEIAAELDDAVLKLPAMDRRIVLMKYFENCQLDEIASDLQLSHGAARTRLSRALEKLRHRLDRRGVSIASIEAATLGDLLTNHLIQRATPGLAQAASSTALSAGAKIGSTYTIAKGAMHMMDWTKAKLVTGLAAAILIGGTGGIVAMNRAAAQNTAPLANPPAQTNDDNEVSIANAPPVVIRTAPVSGINIVDPSLKEIRVTYSKEMQDGSWSWSTWGKDTFPEMTGKPHYLDDHRTCVLPVKLQPNKTYAIWLNSQNFGNFKDKDGRSAVPYLLIFKTRG